MLYDVPLSKHDYTRTVHVGGNYLLVCYTSSNAVVIGLLGHYMLPAVKKERDLPSSISTHRDLMPV